MFTWIHGRSQSHARLQRRPTQRWRAHVHGLCHLLLLLLLLLLQLLLHLLGQHLLLLIL